MVLASQTFLNKENRELLKNASVRGKILYSRVSPSTSKQLSKELGHSQLVDLGPKAGRG